MPEIYTRRIPEQRVPGKPLGRHVRHDSRSLNFLVEEADPATLTSVRHLRVIPVLDQGDLGSCTGNAAEGALGTTPYFQTIPDSAANKPRDDAEIDEEQAVKLYSAATKLDDADGSYPPDDTGSDGLSVAKACKAAGLISGYKHAASLNAALTALAAGPVITGVNWYDSFDTPDADGLVAIAPGAQVRGGHEFVVDEIDVKRKLVGFTNSWGTSWGVEGRAYMSWDTWGQLLAEQGDVTVFVPLSQPAPTPTPTPAPDNPLAELAALIRQGITAVEGWLKSHGL
jgi:hypothetical protein